MRRVGVTLYPHRGFSVDRNVAYLREAKAHGFSRAFASFFAIRGDELSDPHYLDDLRSLGRACRDLGIVLQADVFPSIFHAVGATPEHVEPLVDLGIDELRIDYGYTIDDIATMTQSPTGVKIIINASSTTAEELDQLVAAGADLSRVEASHNMYPRAGTGISMAYLTTRSHRFKERGISVSAFAPAQDYDYGLFEVYDRAPTVEAHRLLTAAEAAEELFACGEIETVWISDGFVAASELKALGETATREHLAIRVNAVHGLGPAELAALFSNLHANRLDEAELVVRSRVVRGQLELTPKNCVARPPYSVTIDNRTYGYRYRGETQITRCDFPADPRVNLVGHVHPNDQRLISYITAGTKFWLVQADA